MAQASYSETFEAVKPTAVIVRTRTSTSQAYQVLRLAFTLAPIVAGIDKFMGRLVNWQQYLAPNVMNTIGPVLMNYIPPAITKNAPFTPHRFMLIVGVLEILIGLLVAFKPSVGAWVVVAWLWAIVVNLLMIPGHYDIVLRDLMLSLAAVALARLARGQARSK